MIEIIGTFNTAKCFASTLEDGAREQIKAVCDTEAFSSSKIRIMPDVHAGKGCTIGTTMTITDKIVPSMVGVDIGCGMYTVYLGNIDIDFEKVDEAAHFIPCGRNVWEGRQERFDLTQLRCYRYLKDSKRLERSLGTLGGGNHFIEVDVDENGGKYLVIHSGSRNLGTQVAEFYQQIAVDLNVGKEEYFKQREEIIRTYKEQGRSTEIQATIKALEKEFNAKEPTLPRDLCFLYDSFMDDYLHDVDICQKFAERNRAKMAEIILERCGWTAVETFQTIHNYIAYPEKIKSNVHAQAFYGVITAILDDVMDINANIDVISDISIHITEIVDKHNMVDWQTNKDIHNKIAQDIDDMFYEIEKEKGIQVDFDSIDKIIENVITVALRRFK